MANEDSGNGGAFRRPPLERQAGDRNLKGAASSVRNKVKYEESVQRLQTIQRRLEQTSEHTPSNCAAHAELLEQTGEIIRLLSSSLQETNVQNENTIRQLQSQLVEVTRERDAAVKDAERLEKIAAKRCAEWEDKLQQERRGFAAAMHKRKKKAHELKRRVNKYGRRFRRMECELNERGGAVEFWEEICAIGKVRPTATDTGVPNTVVIRGEARAGAEKLPNWAEGSDGTMGQQTATTATDSINGSAQPGAENHALRSSMEEFVQLASDMNERMKRFARHHEVSVKDYEEKLEVLGSALKEPNKTEEYYEQVFMDVIKEKYEAMKKATLERYEAYDACGILQVEIDMLRKMPLPPRPSAGARPPPPESTAQRRQAAPGCNLTARVLHELEQPDPGSSRDEDDEAESSQIARSSSEGSLSIGDLTKEGTAVAEKRIRDWFRRGLSFAADTGPSSFLVDSDDSLSFLDSDTSLDWSEGGDAARSLSRNENDDGDGDGDGDGNENDDGDGGDKRDRSGSCDAFEDQLWQMGESRVVTSRNDGASAANARKSDRLKMLSWSQTHSHAIEEGDEESSRGSLGSLDSSGDEGGERGRKSVAVM